MTLLETGELLRQALWEAFERDEAASRHLGSREQIVLREPGPGSGHAPSHLALWLYTIEPSPFRRNAPPSRSPGPGEAPLVLRYLVTPLATDPEGDLVLLDKVLQAFHTAPLIRAPDGRELQIGLDPIGHGELGRIWRSLRQPYRLCLSYQVRGARIEV
jgi:hypothetical protein